MALVAGAAAAKVGERAKTFNFKGTAVCEDGSSISVKVTDGNKRGREAAEAHEEAHPDEPMVFVVVRNTTKFEIDDAPASLSEIVAAGGEVRVQSKAPQGSDSFVAHKVSVETDEDRTALANWRGLLRGRNSDRGPGSRSRAGPTTPDAFAGA